MIFFGWLVTHHVLAVLVGALTFTFAASVVHKRRPTGSALAWLLAIVLIPYVGIPLYLLLGGRKLGLRAARKKRLSLPRAEVEAPQAMGSVQHGGGVGPVTWLDDGGAAYRAFVGEIERARRTIRIQTFLVGADSTGRSLVEALAASASRGVEVRLLLDGLFRFAAPGRSLAKLTAAGGQVETFIPLVHVPFRGRVNLRNHRKLAVFDGERAIVGGMNLASEYMGPEPALGRFRDVNALVTGQAVVALDAVFRADWEFACGRTLARISGSRMIGPGEVRVVPSGPDSPTDAIYDEILTAAFRASRRIWIATPYFVPDDGLARALEVAARRGVDVRVVVPRRSNHRLADLAAAPSLRELAAAGGRVHLYTPGMLHAKALVVDDTLAVIGSANFDMRSLFLDYEIALFLTGSAEVARLAAWFEETLQRSEPGPLASRPLRRALENVCRLLAPLI